MLLWLDHFYHPVFEFTTSYGSFSLMLNPSIEFFCSVIVVFSSMTSIWYFVIFFNCRNSHFVHSLFSWGRWTFFDCYFELFIRKITDLCFIKFFLLRFFLFFCLEHIPGFLHFSWTFVGFYTLAKAAISFSLKGVASCNKLTLLFNLLLDFLSLKSFWLSKQTTFLLAPISWGYVKTCTKRKKS